MHLAIVLSVGKAFRLPLPSLLLASNANVGGPTTASAMAASKGWRSQIMPALLTGVSEGGSGQPYSAHLSSPAPCPQQILGYSVATLISIPLGTELLINIAR